MMTIANFPTAQNVTLHINGVYLDLGFRLDFKDSSPHIPIYGYNDHTYTKTVVGRQIVQGFLVMSFAVPNYLTAIIEELRLGAEDSKLQRYAELLGDLPGVSTAGEREARAGILTSLLFPKGQSNDAKHIKDTLIQLFEAGEPTTSVPKIAGPTSYHIPFDMDVYYHNPETAPWYVRLKAVEITDVSQTISSAGADGSSEPLYETYEFIAKSRDVIYTDRAPSKSKPDKILTIGK